jgi:hypothetical protein
MPVMTETKSQQERASRQTSEGGVLCRSPSSFWLGEQFKLAMQSKRPTKTITWQISTLW